MTTPRSAAGPLLAERAAASALRRLGAGGVSGRMRRSGDAVDQYATDAMTGTFAESEDSPTAGFPARIASLMERGVAVSHLQRNRALRCIAHLMTVGVLVLPARFSVVC